MSLHYLGKLIGEMLFGVACYCTLYMVTHGVSVYTLTFVLKADISSMCCKMMRLTTCLIIFGRQ